jgi:hypothetical protein
MMPSQKMMKVTAKRKETVFPDNPRVGIGLNTFPEPGEINHDALSESGDPPEAPATASTVKDSMLEIIDDDVLVRY